MNWKKAMLAGTLAVTTAALVAGCGGQDKKAADQKMPDKIVIGLDDNFPPMGFRNEGGELVGFDIDLAKEAAKRLGVEVEFKPIDWDSKEAALQSKQVDLLWNGLTITKDRSEKIAFSKPYMKNAQLLVVRADSPITDRAGLAGKIIGTQEGSSSIMPWIRIRNSKIPSRKSRNMAISSTPLWIWKSVVRTAFSSIA